MKNSGHCGECLEDRVKMVPLGLGGRCPECGTVYSEPVVLKAMRGDRAANLESIAKSIKGMLPPREAGPVTVTLSGRQVWDLRGWAEQLLVIAGELRKS